MARVVIVGLSNKPLEINTYNELIGKELELIGSNDRRLHELPLLIEMARRKIPDTSRIITRAIPLEANALEKFSGDVRTMIVPASD
jgi:hypothetical protein